MFPKMASNTIERNLEFALFPFIHKVRAESGTRWPSDIANQ